MIEQIMQDYKIAMKERQENRKLILNYLISQIKNKKIDLQRELTDEEVVNLIRKEVKSLQEGMLFLKKAGKRDELKTEEEKRKVLEGYLPQLMTKEQTKNLIQQMVVELGLIDSQKQKGLLMKEIMSKYMGSIEPELVNQVLLELK
ncbi:GatB/YqeY domain-containing protein [Candidatus Gracilibacteria bacterium]|nr:GatB/YqeY domain-containing protein [Candidatus Gracilibacteria bacterium]